MGILKNGDTIEKKLEAFLVIKISTNRWTRLSRIISGMVLSQFLIMSLVDLFKRFTFDLASMIVLGSNPNSLSIHFPGNVFTKALDDACEATCARHFVPEALWRLGIGTERKLCESWRNIDQFWALHMSKKRENLGNEEGYDLLKCYLTAHEVTGPTPSDKIMRDNIISAFLAIGSTTTTTLTWLLYLLSKNPLVETEIRQELDKNMTRKTEHFSTQQ